MSENELEVPSDIDDDSLDDSVSPLVTVDIAEVELPDFDPEDFEGDENADN
jgi:hypothetical protein